MALGTIFSTVRGAQLQFLSVTHTNESSPRQKKKPLGPPQRWRYVSGWTCLARRGRMKRGTRETFSCPTFGGDIKSLESHYLYTTDVKQTSAIKKSTTFPPGYLEGEPDQL